MKRLAISLAVLALSSGSALAQDHWVPHSASVQAVSADIRAPLESYLLAQATGDQEAARRAFHPDAELWGSRNGALARMTSEAYIVGHNGQAPANPDQRRRWIESIDVTGDTAVAKIVLDYPTVRFTDYMALMRVEDRWVIVNKMYLAQPKPRTQ